MPIERTALDTERRALRPGDQETCLDCPDCDGACWSVIELAFVPERVLQDNRTTTA